MQGGDLERSRMQGRSGEIWRRQGEAACPIPPPPSPRATLVRRRCRRHLRALQVDVVAGVDALLWLVARDSYGNVRAIGGDDFVVNVAPIEQGHSGAFRSWRSDSKRGGGDGTAASCADEAGDSSAPDGICEPADISDRLDGTYGVSFRRMRAGTYLARAWLKGQPCLGKILCHVRPAAAQLEQTSVSGDGLRRAVAGERSSFTVQARDEFGNLAGTGGLKWSASFRAIGAPDELLARPELLEAVRGATIDPAASPMSPLLTPLPSLLMSSCAPWRATRVSP